MKRPDTLSEIPEPEEQLELQTQQEWLNGLTFSTMNYNKFEEQFIMHQKSWKLEKQKKMVEWIASSLIITTEFRSNSRCKLKKEGN